MINERALLNHDPRGSRRPRGRRRWNVELLEDFSLGERPKPGSFPFKRLIQVDGEMTTGDRNLCADGMRLLSGLEMPPAQHLGVGCPSSHVLWKSCSWILPTED